MRASRRPTVGRSRGHAAVSNVGLIADQQSAWSNNENEPGADGGVSSALARPGHQCYCSARAGPICGARTGFAMP
jgi:hypothetical protein